MDIGLEYMKELGLKPAKSLSQIETALTRAAGTEYKKKIIDASDKRATDKCTSDFYSLKNSNFKGSLALTGAFDADILREVCNWISNNQDYFSGSILEIGCDLGVVSCFLARLFPDKTITSIDRCEEAIENAKILAKQLDVTNVRFLKSSDPELNGKKFDTVFSMRTIHENMVSDTPKEPFDMLWDLGMEMKENLQDYARTVSDYMSEGSTLISIERAARRYINLGWMWALNECGIIAAPAIDKQTIRAKEIKEIHEFPIFIGVKDEPSNEETVYFLFNLFFANEIDDSGSTYLGEEALLVLQNSVKKVVKWIGFRNRYSKRIEAMYAVFETEDPTAIALYEARNNNDGIFMRLRNFTIETKDGLMEELDSLVLNPAYKNHVCEDYDYSESLFKVDDIRDHIFHLN